MSNMSYCRFRNTLADLRDCQDNMDDDDLSHEEKHAKEQLIALCLDIAEYSEDWEQLIMNIVRKRTVQLIDIEYPLPQLGEVFDKLNDQYGRASYRIIRSGPYETIKRGIGLLIIELTIDDQVFVDGK